MLHCIGKNIGLEKWNAYCNKQSITNSFDYKQEKYGWTKEQFDEYNASRAVTLRNLQRKHGIEAGTEKFDNYCKRQAYAGNDKQYFVERYGETVGAQKYLELNKKKGSAAAIAARNGNLFIHQSKIGKEFCSMLDDICGDIGKVYYSHDGQREFRVGVR